MDLKVDKSESEGIVITTDDIDACWARYHKEYLVDILNGDYDLREAREDILSLIGSLFDMRKQ